MASAVLLLAACGDDGDSSEASGSPTTAAVTTTTAAATTTAAPATTAAVTTTAPPATTEAATTTTEAATTTTAAAPESPLPVGASTGRWNNDTFGSTGAATADVSQAANTMSVSLDLTDGFVLGAGVADVFTLDLPIDQLASGVTVENATLGTLTITIVDGQIEVVGTNSPVGGIAGFTASGTITGTTLSGTYEVQFDAGDPATGTFEFPLG